MLNIILTNSYYLYKVNLYLNQIVAQYLLTNAMLLSEYFNLKPNKKQQKKASVFQNSITKVKTQKQSLLNKIFKLLKASIETMLQISLQKQDETQCEIFWSNQAENQQQQIFQNTKTQSIAISKISQDDISQLCLQKESKHIIQQAQVFSFEPSQQYKSHKQNLGNQLQQKQKTVQEQQTSNIFIDLTCFQYLPINIQKFKLKQELNYQQQVKIANQNITDSQSQSTITLSIRKQIDNKSLQSTQKEKNRKQQDGQSFPIFNNQTNCISKSSLQYAQTTNKQLKQTKLQIKIHQRFQNKIKQRTKKQNNKNYFKAFTFDIGLQKNIDRYKQIVINLQNKEIKKRELNCKKKQFTGQTEKNQKNSSQSFQEQDFCYFAEFQSQNRNNNFDPLQCILGHNQTSENTISFINDFDRNLQRKKDKLPNFLKQQYLQCYQQDFEKILKQIQECQSKKIQHFVNALSLAYQQQNYLQENYLY